MIMRFLVLSAKGYRVMRMHGWEGIWIIINQLMPESKIKEFLRSRYFRYANFLYALNRIVTRAQLIEGDVLLVRLDNGLVFYGPRDKTPSVELRYGNPRKLANIRDFTYFGYFLDVLHWQYVQDVYERYYSIGKGDIVVDIGAHVGTFTVKAAKAVGEEGKVIAIEPDACNLSLLRRNVEANSLQNVEIVPKGVWSKKGRLAFYTSDNTTAHSFSAHWAGSNESSEVEVDTLDNILREHNIKEVNFIKMNVEAAETEALRGMNEVLACNPNLAVSAHHTVDGKRSYELIAPLLKELGFKVRVKQEIVYAGGKTTRASDQPGVP